MSLYYNHQTFEDDLTHTWGTNTIIDPASLGNLDPSGIPPQHTYIKSERTQPGTYLQPTEYLPVTSTHNVEPTFQRGSSLGFDPSSSYVSGGYGYPWQDTTFFSNNAAFSILGGQHNQPVLSYAQQPLSYNRRCPNPNTELAQDNPSSVYPPLDGHSVYGSLPYGDWVIRQAQQNFLPPMMNPYPVNAGRSMNSPYQPQRTQTEGSQNSTKENEEPATARKDGRNGAAKRKKKDPPYDPRHLYSKAETRAPWGSKTFQDGQHLFSYTEKGQLLSDRKFTNEQLREYVDNCPKDTVFRVQQYPTMSAFRMAPEDRLCRWADCPVGSKKITPGWLRVCFDEFPEDTSSGKRDPFVCAGSMHLWCFEQVFDPVEFHLKGRLKAETRLFVHENQNVMSLEKLTDVDIVKNAYDEWFKQWVPSFERHRNFQVQREYKDTLCSKLSEYHINNQSEARRTARASRHDQKKNKEEPKKTIEVHRGDLKLYVALTEMAQNAKRANQTPEMGGREDVPGDGLDSPGSSRIRRTPPPSPRTKKAGSPERLASYLPIDPSLATSSSHPSQTQRRSPRGSDQKQASTRRRKKAAMRRVLASQLPVDQGHNISTDSCSSTSTGYLNTNSTSSSSFSPLNPACGTLPPSNLRPPSKIIVPPDQNHSSLANAYTSVYSQAMPGPGFSMEDPKQPGHSLAPPPWQYQQQQYSSTAALPYVKAEHQPQFQDCYLNAPLEASRGNDLVESCQNETKTWTQEAADEASQVLGDSEGTSLNDSNQFNGLGPEEASIYQFLIIDEDVPESTQNPAEGSTGAMDNVAAQTQVNAAASQPLELVAGAESPPVAAVAETWHSFGSFMDPVNYGGYSNTDILPLFDDSIATA
ncbi:hypothetical protein MKX08_009807 [Trichoderma sp. CBMAI-0020]|nr:hypothetical protein MKX08_009807 [Trichoderma sp. CBMAI-0020]